MNKQEIIEYLGLDNDEEFTELGKWSLPEAPIEKSKLKEWCQENLENTRIFLKEEEAAASIGLDVNEFRNHRDIFDVCRYKRNIGYYLTNRIEKIYKENLKRDTIYSSHEGSNKHFCISIGAQPVPCYICGIKAVRYICNNCRNPICQKCNRYIQIKIKSRFVQKSVCQSCKNEKRE